MNADQIQSLIEENRMLQQEIRTLRQQSDIITNLLIKQFQETEKILDHFQFAGALHEAVMNTASQVSIIAANIKGIIIAFNSGAENLLGYHAEEVIGKYGPEIFHLKSELDKQAEILSRKLGQKFEEFDIFYQYALFSCSESQEWTYLRKDGTQVPVCVLFTPLTDLKKTVIGFLAIATDISERKHSEKIIEETEEKYRLLIKNIPNIIFRGYADGSLDIVDEKVENLTGYAKEDFLSGRIRWFDLILEEDAAPAKAVFKQALKGTKSYIREYRFRSKNGEIIWVQEVAQIVCNRDGEIAFITGSVLNISKRKLAEAELRKAKDELEIRVRERTAELAEANSELQAEIAERMQAEEALRNSEKKYRSIFENSAGGIYQSDPRGRILTANPAFVKIMGYDSEEDLIRNVINLKEQFYADPEKRDALQKLFKESDVIKDFETRFYRKDRSIIEVLLNARAIRDDNRKILYYEGILEDITQRKRLEEMKVAKEAAEASSQAKSNFLANMSHEIRTPMNAIMGLTELVLRTELMPRQRDYLGKIKLSAHTLLGIINDILDFSKIEAGRLDLESLDFQLYEVMDSLSDMFSNKASEKGIELVISVADDVPCTLIGDPLRLGQVLTNLINNAVKFTHSGEVIVRAELVYARESENADNRMRIRFTVRDTGIGIPPDYLPRLFEAFTQANGSMSRKYGGTGLGLAISKRLVEMMNGKIRAESVPGKGTVFSFTVPFMLQPGESVQKPPVPENIQGRRILIVDDNISSGKIFTKILKSSGFEAAFVASGPAALEELEVSHRDKPYDLVLMDWMMPEMDGIETLGRMKASHHFFSIPVIMMTGFGREEIMQKAALAGADGFLIKPIKQSLLSDAIVKVFGYESAGFPKKERIKIRTSEQIENFQGKRVLLVEDNSINRQVAVEILESAGISVETAFNGIEALKMITEKTSHFSLLTSHFYDAVLMDLQMPEMDGYEATRRIREWEQVAGDRGQGTGRDTACRVSTTPCDLQPATCDLRPATCNLQPVPIIAMTAHAMKGERKRCMEAGMNDFIVKPINTNQLFSTLSRWITAGKENLKSEKPDAESAGFITSDQNSKPADPVIDTDAALQRLTGNRKLLLDLLQEFAGNYADAAAKIREALNGNDTEFIRHLAHTLKGVAGNLSATRLYAAALRTERAIRLKSDVKFPATQLEQALNEVLQTIPLLKISETDDNCGTQIEDCPSPNMNSQPADISREPEKAAPLLVKLENMLKANDLDAADCLTEIKAFLTDAGLRDDLKKMENEINNLHFESAQKTLSEIVIMLDSSQKGKD